MSTRERHGRFLRLAGPMILSNVSVPLLGAVDTAVVGHLPDPIYLGGVAVGASLFTFVFWAFGFLRMSTTGFAAQAVGRGVQEEAGAVAIRALIMAAAIGLVLILAADMIADLGFALISASPAVEREARIYFAIRILAAPATLCGYVFLGWFLGIQNARTTLLLQLVVNGLNIALDLLFVVGFGWKVAGVAWATVVAEYACLGVGATLMIRALRTRNAVGVRRAHFARGILRRMLVVNLDIFIRTALLVAALLWFTALGARMGDDNLAANAVLMNFHLFAAFTLDGFAYATQALVGMAVGARDRDELRRAVRVAAVWSGASAGLFSIVYGVAGTLIIAALTSLSEIRAVATEFLPWAVLAPIVSAAAFLLDGAFVGATRSAEQRNAMILSAVVFVLACATLIPVWQNHGLWLSFLLFMAARGATLCVMYPRLARSV